MDHNQEKLNKVVLKNYRAFTVGYHCGDVSINLDVKIGLEKCLSKFGRVDVPVVNAAMMEKVSFLDFNEVQWDRILAVNLKVFFYGARL